MYEAHLCNGEEQTPTTAPLPCLHKKVEIPSMHPTYSHPGGANKGAQCTPFPGLQNKEEEGHEFLKTSLFPMI